MQGTKPVRRRVRPATEGTPGSSQWGVSLHPQGRPCGRPPAAAVLAPAATRRPPEIRPHPPRLV